MRMHLLPRRVWLALVVGLLSGWFAGAARGSDPGRMVLVLHPDANDARPGNVLVDRAIRSALAKGAPTGIEVNSEPREVTRSTDPAYPRQVAEFLRRKYAGRKIDLVIASLTPALDFALKYRGQAFPGVPIVFCAVDEREVNARSLPPDVIGVPIRVDLAATLDVALRLHPRPERVYVITGKSKLDVHWEEEARRTFRGYEDRLEFVYLSGLPMPDLLKRVAELGEHSVAYYLQVTEDGDGQMVVPAEILERI